MVATVARSDWKEAGVNAAIVVAFFAVTGAIAAVPVLSRHIVETVPAGIVQAVDVAAGSDGTAVGNGHGRKPHSQVFRWLKLQ